ncbi:MAG TPA: hypothetical protein DEG70_00630 [Chloroflexi bacterium]|nr:hypothetical protein [Chloroflexota bacterium]
MTTLVIPLSDPQVDLDGIAARAIDCTRMIPGGDDAAVVVVSAVSRDEQAAPRQDYLDGVAGSIGERARSLVEYGDPAVVILDAAAEVEHPVIVMASHGRRGVERKVLGSVAGRVVTGARCPVVILPGVTVACPVRLRHVLIPIDSLEKAGDLVEAVIELLGPQRDIAPTLHLLDIADPTPPRPAIVHGEAFESSHEVPAHALRRVAENAARDGLSATWEVRIGDRARQTAVAAREGEADLIVLAARSQVDIERTLAGLLAELVSQQLPVPVLVLPPAWLRSRDAQTPINTAWAG